MYLRVRQLFTDSFDNLELDNARMISTSTLALAVTLTLISSL